MIQRILVEQMCEGCLDGRVQTSGTYEPSKECERCKGTGVEHASISLDELRVLILGIEVPEVVKMHDDQIRALNARCRLIDGFQEYTNSWAVPRVYNSAMLAEQARLERLRWLFGGIASPAI